MKRMLLWIAAVMLTACANQNNTQTANPEQVTNTPAITEHVVDWTKPLYCLDENGDTVARWVYDQEGQLAQLYVLGELYEGEFQGEDNTSDGSYIEFDSKGRLQVIVKATDEDAFRYEFKYGYEEEEEEDEDAWHSPYEEQDVEMEYDDLDRVTFMSFRIRWSYFSANLSYEDNLCYVNAVFSVPEMDEMGMPIDTDSNDTYYEYSIYY